MSKTRTQFNRNRPASQGRAGKDPLLEAWDKTLRVNRDRAAILDQSGKILRTFTHIEERARAFGRQVDRFGPGRVIALQLGNHHDWPSLFLACLRHHLVLLPLEQTISDEQRKAACETCHVVAVAALTGKGVKLQRVLSMRTPTTTALWQNDPPSLLKLTSGTTATPRAIRFRSEQLLADCENICDTMGITARDLNFGVIPISHSYGFSNLLTPLLARGIPVALSNDRMPRAILNGMAASAASVFAGTPVFYQSFCELSDAPPLPKLRLCISAGAPLNVTIAQGFRERFRRAIHSFYGSSECGGICYVREPNDIAGLVGPPMLGVEIEPVGRENASSIVRVRSRAVGDGYFPTGDKRRLGGGVFMPDDLLEKTPQGYRIVGRVSDLINVAGKKVNPAEIEAELLRCKGVRQAVVFGRESPRRNQEVMACVVAESSTEEATLLKLCRARLSSWQMPRRIYFVDSIPVTERGKVIRRELARRYGVGAEAAVTNAARDSV